jgi:hypothetical protein
MEAIINTTIIIKVNLTELEAREALIDPKPVQTKLREALAPLADIRKTRWGRASPTGAKSKKERVTCKVCKKPLRPSSVNYHMRHNHPDAAAD